jgi:hypothetical protein
MANAREKSEWNRASHLLAWIQNWSGYAEQGVDPFELNPYSETKKREKTIDAKDLAFMLCGQKAAEAFARIDAQQQLDKG